MLQTWQSPCVWRFYNTWQIYATLHSGLWNLGSGSGEVKAHFYYSDSLVSDQSCVSEVHLVHVLWFNPGWRSTIRAVRYLAK